MTIQTSAIEEPDRRISTSLIAFSLGVYLLALSMGVFVIIYDVWFSNFAVAKSLGFQPPASTAGDALTNVRALALTVFGAALGACLMSLLGIYKHGIVLRDFQRRYIGSYLLGPLAVCFLGFAVFVLVRAGLFAFGGVADLTKLQPANEVSFLALGLLSGYSWDHVLTKIQKITKEIFASSAE